MSTRKGWADGRGQHQRLHQIGKGYQYVVIDTLTRSRADLGLSALFAINSTETTTLRSFKAPLRVSWRLVAVESFELSCPDKHSRQT